MTKKFNGKIALVTGADSGVGGRPPRGGWRDDRGWRAPYRSRQVAGRSIRRGRARRRRFRRDPDAIVRAVAGIVERHGNLDILVNAAGPMPFKPLAELEPDDWRETLDVDLIGPFVLVREMLRPGRPGAIINVASVHALAVEPNAAVHAAAKAALLSLTRSVAIKGREAGLRANVILPGAIDTPMLWTNPNVKSGQEHIEPSELGQPHDVAALTAFLASADAAFINGAAITVDGGRIAHL